MRMFNIHEAKTHLSRLLADVARGETVTIARAGKPIATLNAIRPVSALRKPRYGFLKGQFTAPDDIKIPFAAEIEQMFYGEDE